MAHLNTARHYADTQSSMTTEPRFRHLSVTSISKVAEGSLALVLAAILPLLRQTGTPSWRAIWAEDGSIYYSQARLHGVGVLFRGYHGYLQLPPRLLGAVSTAVPPRYLAVFLALAGTCVLALLGWFCYWASDGWVGSRLVRLVLGVLVVLMPVLGYENTANITNVIWGFGAVAPWALIAASDRPRGAIARGGVAFLGATSTALAALLLPLALVLGAIRRTCGSWAVVVAFVVGLAVQGAVVLTTPNTQPAIHPSFALLAKATGINVFGQLTVGSDATTTLSGAHAVLFAAASGAFTTVILLVLLVRADRRSQLMELTFAGYAVLTYSATLWGRGLLVTGPRFSVMPVMFIASAVAILVSPKTATRTSGWRQVSVAIFVAWTLTLIALDFRVTNPRSVAPAWAQSARRTYEASCLIAPPERLVAVATRAPFVLRLGGRTYYINSVALFPVELRCQDLVWSK